VKKELVISTRVGRAGWMDHRFRGHALYEDLLGRESLLSLLFLGMSGRRLPRSEALLLDEIACVFAITDPHIWPIKLVRVASSHGHSLPGLAAGLLAMDHAQLGSWTTQSAGSMLAELRGRNSLRGAVEQMLAEGRRLPGFGVPGRPRDERVEALTRCIRAHGREHAWWLHFRALAEVVASLKGLRPNIGSALAAALLDLGLEVEQLGTMPTILLLGSFVPNALESAEQRSPILQSLPQEHVRYAGATARPSPRASEVL